MLLKRCTQYASKFGKLSSGHRTEKGQVFIPIPKKGNAKECSNYCTVILISHTSKVMLKFSKPGFNSIQTENFQMFKLDLEKAEEPERKLLTLLDHRKSKRIPEKNICFIDYTKTFDCVDQNKLWEILK